MTLTKDARIILLLAAVLVVGLGIGLVARDVVPAAQSKLAPNPEKEFAIVFYKAFSLNQDAEAAWDMMHPLEQKGWGDREGFLQSWRRINRMPTPDKLEIQEWRRPQQNAYTYLIQAKDMNPAVIVVVLENGKPYVLDTRIWEGEALP